MKEDAVHWMIVYYPAWTNRDAMLVGLLLLFR